MTESVAAQEIVDLARLRLAPGDILVVRFRDRATAEVAAKWRDILKERIENDVLVLACDVDLAVLTREDILEITA